MNKKNTESILDKVTAEIRSEQVDSSAVNQAAERVWARLSVENADRGSDLKAETVAVDRIENCADFQSLIPAYLNGHLSEARSLLLVDHTHECIPCRKAMKEARSQNLAPKKTATAPRRYSLPARRFALGYRSCPCNRFRPARASFHTALRAVWWPLGSDC